MTRGGDSTAGTLARLAELLRTRRVSSTELTTEALRRLETVGPSLRAVAAVTRERALAEARAADDRLAHNRPRSPLDGLPYAVKDALADRTVPTEWGSPAFAGRQLEADSAVVRRMAHAGAVLVGKLALIQLCGAGSYRSPDASVTGACRNPWDPSRWSGGSSSGSGSAVGADLVPLAFGTDTTGSIVAPAAFCGITGLRPSLGVVSRSGCCPVSWSMDVIGPMARSASDCRMGLDAVAGRDAGDPLSTRPAWRRVPRHPIRIGVVHPPADAPVGTATAFDAALRVLTDDGNVLRPIDLPLDRLDEVAVTIMNVEASEALRWLIESPAVDRLLNTGQREGLRRAATTSVHAFAAALEARAALRARLDALFEAVDVIAAPTRVTEAPPIDREIDRSSRGPSRIASLGGLPAISVPMGVGDRGLPLGLWLAGPRLGDPVVLRIAERFQLATDFHLRRPPASAGAWDQLAA